MKNILAFLLLIGTFLFGHVGEAGTGYAVLVGVVKAGDPNYDDRATAGSADDVNNVYELLVRARGFDEKNIICLTTTEQTRPRFILKALQEQIKKADGDDLFVFYFSGHGTQKPEPDGKPTDESDTDGLDEYLVGYQGDICDDDLADIWQSANARARLVVILDACHSGAVPTLALARATSDHPYKVPVAEYVTLAEPVRPVLRASRRSRTGLRRTALSASTAITTSRLGECLSQTIDARPTYHLIYLGAVLDEASATTAPDGRGEFTLKLVSLTSQYPGASYRDFAHRLLPGEGICTSEAAYAELGAVPDEFANSIFLKP